MSSNQVLFEVILLLLAVSLFGILSGARLVRNQAKKPLPPAPMAEPARSPYTESLAATGLIQPDTPYLVVLAVLMVSGFFRSLEFTCLNALSFADVDDARMSNATSFSSVAQQLSLGMGVALAALLLSLMPGVAAGHAVARIDPGDFLPIFGAAGLMCAASWLWFRTLAPNACEVMSGYRRKLPPVDQPAE